MYKTLSDEYTRMFTQQWMVSGDSEGGWLAFARCSVRNGSHFPRVMQDFDPFTVDDHWCAPPTPSMFALHCTGPSAQPSC